jgi:hypothetical protein
MKKYILMLGLIVFSLNMLSQPTYIQRSKQNIYLNGINLAWINFADDLADFDEDQFTEAVTKIHAAGGNSMRWWIHVDGTYNPVFTNDSVTSISSSDIANLKKALDIAYSNGVLIDLCLWSFDMLQSGKTDDVYARNMKLLTDSLYTRAYINNALIPMVKALKSHPGVLCWEVFNEPEGMTTQFGWTHAKSGYSVDITYVQRVVNMVAGAIHREAPDALVSNGSQLIRFTSDVKTESDASWMNYYRDDRLIQAGGDAKGTLDFYMVHYYSSNGSKYSVFAHPASYWDVGKPLAIGEFPAVGFPSSMSSVECYKYAYNNGYAGALSWAYTGGGDNGGLSDCAAALDSIESIDPTHVDVVPDSSFDFPPYVKKTVPDRFVYLGKTDTITVGNLFDWFGKKIDSVHLKFSVDSISPIANILVSPVDTINTTPYDYLKVVPRKGKAGIFTTTITATDTAGKSVYTPFVFSVIDSTSENRFQYRNIYSSTIEDISYLPAYAVDSLPTTRWSTQYKDNQWYLVRLDKEYQIQRIMIHWEVAYGKKYNVEVSTDSLNWQTIFTETYSDGGYDKLIFSPVTAKFIRLNCVERGTAYGFSIYELQGYSTKGTNTPPKITTAIADQFAVAVSPYSLTISKSVVTDLDQGERLFFSVTSSDGSDLPSWLTFTDSTRVLSGRAGNNDIGTYSLMLKVKDLFGASDSSAFTLTVSANHSPVISNPVPAAIISYKKRSSSILISSNTATDSDAGDSLSYSVVLAGTSILPEWLYFDSAAMTIYCTPTISDSGVYQLVLIVSDLAGNQATDTFKLTVSSSTTSVSIASSLKDLNIYPNPAKNSLNITWGTEVLESVELSVIDCFGRTLIAKEIQPGGFESTYTLDVSVLQTGIYIVKLQNDGSVINRKVQIIR